MNLEEILDQLRKKEITPEEAKQKIALVKIKFRKLTNLNSDNFDVDADGIQKKKSKIVSLAHPFAVDETTGEGCKGERNESPNPIPFKAEVKKQLEFSEQSLYKKNIRSVDSEIINSTLQCEKIAIIGMAGQFPKANNLQEYWNNLVHGIDCISEVPESRWSTEEYYDEDHTSPGKTNCKWIGLLDDADKFDPVFFNISPFEAVTIDPQQRLFLQNCWHAIEDSGIKASSLSGSRCGVYVGCTMGDYGGTDLSAFGLTGKAVSILSARIAYLLNLKGSSVAMDTACSSSLVAICEACNNLVLGNIDLCLAGGVSILSTPQLHIMASKAGMLSKDGKCFTFDQRANGFVPGEGVGVIILKRLSDAIRDNDNIHGVISGWGTNQDGKTNGITAPSVKSQISLIKDIYRKFKINTESITFIETHGTGTKLGDPIEVEALIESFKSFTKKTNYCALGSVKSNIGHLLGAGGIASVIKVLLSLKNETIPPMVHFENLNEHIKLSHSPFYINKVLKPWDPISNDTRKAGVSSFGYSGTNAHLVIEEYFPEVIPADHIAANGGDEEVLFVLSARTKDRLVEYAINMQNYLSNEKKLNIHNAAYTMQVCREEMEYRLALIANSRESLFSNLQKFIKGEKTDDTIEGIAKKGQDLIEVFESDNELQTLIQGWIKDKKLGKIAELWAKGVKIDWSLLYGAKPSRITLPFYPFSKECFWKKSDERIGVSQDIRALQIHPLLHKNVSDFEKQRFESIFTGKELFLREYKLGDYTLFPPAIFLEMSRVANSLSSDIANTEWTLVFTKLKWNSPLVIDSSLGKITAELVKTIGGKVLFEFWKHDDNSDRHILFQGSIETIANEYKNHIEMVEENAYVQTIAAQDIYTQFAKSGIIYGKIYQVLEKICIGENKAFGKISTDKLKRSNEFNFAINPAIIDSALQVAVIFKHGAQETLESPKINPPPFITSIDKMEVYIPKNPIELIFVMQQSDCVEKMDVQLVDRDGNICMEMKGLMFSYDFQGIAAQSHVQSNRIKPESSIDEDSLRNYIVESLSEMLFLPTEDLNINKKFIDMGMDSIVAVEWLKAINKKYGTSFKGPIIYDFSTVSEFTELLFKELNERNEAKDTGSDVTPNGSISTEAGSQLENRNLRSIFSHIQNESSKKGMHPSKEPIAIIGMSGRYPEAFNLDEYWNNLALSRNSVKEVPFSRWDVNEYYDPDPKKILNGKIYCKWLGAMENIDQFDPLFFNISPAEAEAMDPQQRLFLQESYKAFEDAGYSPQMLSNSKCGVYLGIMYNEYGQIFNSGELLMTSASGNSNAIAAARASYFLNLKGPAMPIDTACSSSLVATYLALQALRNHEINMALVGGVTLYLSPKTYIGMSAVGMLSPDGQCKTFDDSANGFVPGEGVGALVLKRLSDAEKDHDNIYGLIIGAGINQDGKTNGITAPSMKSQIELEREVYSDNDINPESIDYVEMHGTGTKIGDPIELEALSTVYKEKTNKRNFCAIGSVKTNIGHTSAAAGIASIHKVLLSLKNNKIVPSLHYNKPNEHFNFEESPFFVNTEIKNWEKEITKPRRAAISSFGFSGTNAHIVVEEYRMKSIKTTLENQQEVLFVLSAKTKVQLREYAGNISTWLKVQQEVNLFNFAFTLQTGRDEMEHRLAFCVNSKDKIVNVLEEYLNNVENKVMVGEVPDRNRVADLINIKQSDIKPLETWYSTQNLQKIGEAWVNGSKIDWRLLYQDELPYKMSFPTYPFAKEHYWIESKEKSYAKSEENKPLSTEINRREDLPFLNQQAVSKRVAYSLNGMDELKEKGIQYFRKMMSETLKISEEKISASALMTNYGFDSISVVPMTIKLKNLFDDDISSALLFQYQTIESLVAYFIANYESKLAILVDFDMKAENS